MPVNCAIIPGHLPKENLDKGRWLKVGEIMLAGAYYDSMYVILALVRVLRGAKAANLWGSLLSKSLIEMSTHLKCCPRWCMVNCVVWKKLIFNQ